jgi:rod shape-determining protein MreD
VLTGCLLVAAIVCQVTVLNRLGVPGSAPDLVLAVVAAVALAHGATHGAIAGFAGGVLLDLAPPADHPVGLWALALTLVGYVVGSVADASDRPSGVRPSGLRPRMIALVAALAALSTVVVVAISGALGDPTPTAGQTARLVLSAALYDAVLAALVVWALRGLLGWSADGGARRPRRAMAGRPT